jgi:cell division topological specificity factor MinE
MNLFSFFAPIRSAPVARKRLHILLDADRSLNKQSDLVAILRDEIFARFGRYVTFDPRTVRVREVNGAAVCTLVIDLEMPERFKSAAMAAIGSVRGRQVPTLSTQDTASVWRSGPPIRAAEQAASSDRKLALRNRASSLEPV